MRPSSLVLIGLVAEQAALGGPGSAAASPAGSPRGSIEDQALDDLLDLMDDEMDQSASVADRLARSQREAPALVSVFTGEELQRLGARDLVDALRLMPGVEFGSDLWNTDLLLTRGTQADGRVLVLVDGHELNEGTYGSTPLANRIPIAVIARIEVIRGPGSAVYGGNALLAVVRVVTHAPTQSGVRLDAEQSWLPTGAYGRRDLAMSAGAEIAGDGHLGVSAVFGQGRRSDDVYTDVKGRSFDQTEASNLDPALLSTSFTYRGLDVALAAESYRHTWRDGGARITFKDRDNDFSGLYGRASYTLPLGARASVTALAFSRYQLPWRSQRRVVPAQYDYFAGRTLHSGGGVSTVVRPFDRLTLQGGGELGAVHAAVDAGGDGAGTELSRYTLGDVWAEGVYDSPIGSVTAGMRVDAGTFGDAVSPRLVLVEAKRSFHYKVGVTQAFRTPGVTQAGPEVAPETSSAYDAELGIAPTRWSYLTFAAFDTKVYDPFLYFYAYDPDTGEESDGYLNGDAFQTYGFELDLEALSGPVRANLGWATARPLGPQPADYQVPGVTGHTLGLASDKAVLRVSWDPGEHLVLGAVATWLSPRWAITSVIAGEPMYEKLPGSIVFDASAGVEDVWKRGLSVGLSIHDLLDTNPPTPQAYAGLHAPTPGTGREILARVTVQR